MQIDDFIWLPDIVDKRYLIVFFIHKADNTALVLSARDMDRRERRRYERK